MPRNPSSQDAPSSRFDMLADEQAPETVPFPDPGPDPVPDPAPSQNPNVPEPRPIPEMVITPEPTRFAWLGLQVSEVLPLIKARPWFTRPCQVSTSAMNGDRCQVQGHGLVMVRGLNPDSEFSRTVDADDTNRCRCLYMRPYTYALQSISFKHLMRWLKSLPTSTRLHATDGTRIYPVVGVRWVNSDGAEGWRGLNLHFSLGPEVTG